MLYDPKWETKTQPDVFSLEGLIAWLETQPGDRAYIWAGKECLICQYLVANGRRFGEYGKFPIELRQQIVHPMCGEQTFGAALYRARRLAK